jgi:hypothetical protein
MGRSGLVAYLVGAGVAGSLLVFPYMARPIVAAFVPGFTAVSVPFFLLPVVWGFWNWLYARLSPTIDVGLWGAALGLMLGLGLNVYLYSQGTWFPAAVALPVLLSGLYFVLWHMIVGPLTAALGG